jgi:hypothetical protein
MTRECVVGGLALYVCAEQPITVSDGNVKGFVSLSGLQLQEPSAWE